MKGASRFLATAVSAFLCATGAAEAQWVFLGKKAVGVVRQLTSETKEGHHTGYDSATVLLEARAENVYRKAIEVVNASEGYRITRQTDSALTLEFTDGKMLAGLQVNPLDEHLSQLLIVSNSAPAERSGSSIVVNGVLRICKKMGIHCEQPPP